ncbi:MAG: tyrosine protein kinase [Tannerellaceae bacterium]|nr:tyrosine protein kinase [Tannerellaceae bacterium]
MEVKDNESLGLKPIIIKYLLQWRLFLAAFLFSFLLAILYLIFYPKTYEVKASIQLQKDKDMAGSNFRLGEAVGMMESFGLGELGTTGINLEDELAILKSNALLKRTTQELGINFTYTKPFSFYRLYDEEQPVILSLDKAAQEKLFENIEFSIKGEKGRIEVKVKSKSSGKETYVFNSLPATIEFAGCNFMLDYKDKQNPHAYFNVDVVYQPAVWAGEDLADEIHIEDISKTANIIEIVYCDYEVNRAIDILNKLIDLYDKDSFAYKEKDAKASVEFLSIRIDSIVGELNKTEKIISDYKQSNKLTAIEYDIQFYVEQMKELQGRLIELESQLYVINLMDDFVKNPENKYNLIPMLMTANGESESSLTLYNEVLLERARVIQNSNGNNPLISTLTEQADKLRESVYLSIHNAKQSIQMAIQDVKQKESAIVNKMGEYPNLEMSYIDLQRQQEIFQGIYLILLQKREELLLFIGDGKSKVRIVDPPYVKGKPVGPRKLYAAIGIFLFTLIIPIGFLFIKEQYISLRHEYLRVKN